MENIININTKPFIIKYCSCGNRNVLPFRIYKNNKEVKCYKCHKRLREDNENL